MYSFAQRAKENTYAKLHAFPNPIAAKDLKAAAGNGSKENRKQSWALEQREPACAINKGRSCNKISRILTSLAALST
jgi:hypothetical protein